MSGGHLDYLAFKIRDAMETAARDGEYKKIAPLTMAVFEALAVPLSDAEHDLDWHVSGDIIIKNFSEFDRQTLGKILTELFKVCPDEWFPRGKWATIQAFQERSQPAAARGEGE